MASESRQSDPDLSAAGAAAFPEPLSELPAPPDYSAEDFSDVPLDQLLFQEPYRFEFFAALRVIARLRGVQSADGEEASDATSRVRFRALQSLSFPPSEIWDIVRPDSPEDPIEMTVAFLGLTGPLGALPRPYTELVMQRVRKGDRALRDFLLSAT
jgi:type VI secretion system protein ImpH